MSDPITRLNAALEGRYRIEHELGEGGMATVYLARDERHNRNVALKVLKPELAAVVGADRFLAEIETTANLQHPHILPLFDSGEADGFLFYVMPYVEGESLRERLGREHQLPVEEAVTIATKVAGALQAAHESGIIHRDIKPANILLSKGEPLVSDFGIALAVGSAGRGRLTETGLSLGTPHYMSPEQATGDQPIGPPSDIYSLGSVLYEMLTSEPPYVGRTPQALLAKIISGDPVSASATRPTVPPNVDAAVRRATERVPADRFASGRDLAAALGDPSFRHGPSQPIEGASSRAWRRATTTLALYAVVSTGALILLLARPAPSEDVIRYELTFPAGEAPVTAAGASGTSLALSPDGQSLAYVGPTESGQEGQYQIWVREQHRLQGSPVSGTADGLQPFFAPEGDRLGFISNGALKVVPIEGGPPRTVVESGVSRRGAAWTRDGYIYYASGDGLHRVSVSDGRMERVAQTDPRLLEIGYAWPDPLPGGRGLLVTIERQLRAAYAPGADIGVVDLATGDVEPLFPGRLAQYAPSGHVVFVTDEGELLSVPFDARRLRPTGPAVPLLTGLPTLERGPDLALSRSGRLVYRSTGTTRNRELVWYNRAGEPTPVEPGVTIVPNPTGSGPALDREGRRIAMDVLGVGGRLELYIIGLGGPSYPLPFDGRAYRPTWEPDGRSLLFMSDERSVSFDVWRRRADGSADPELVYDLDDPVAEARYSPDGEWIVLRTSDPFNDIYAVRPGEDGSPIPLLDGEFSGVSPTVSPDGRFLAYASSLSRRSEVYVRPFPEVDSGAVQVSLDGGTEPLWAHNGHELFYRSEAGELVVATFDTTEGFEVLDRRPLFIIPPGPIYGLSHTYDVSGDDQRFLTFRLPGGSGGPGSTEYIVVESFQRELRAAHGS